VPAARGPIQTTIKAIKDSQSDMVSGDKRTSPDYHQKTWEGSQDRGLSHTKKPP